MKAYWDSSALLECANGTPLRDRLRSERGFTRLHTLTECFSALTGKSALGVPAQEAAIHLRELSRDLDFVDLSASDILSALDRARQLGVRGGRVHDLLHAVAADKSGAGELLTLDRNDFAGLTELQVTVL